MESPPQMYDSGTLVNGGIGDKKTMAASANNNSAQQQNNPANGNAPANNNNNPGTINQNLVARNQPMQNGLNGTLNNNILIQKQMLQQMQGYAGELDELSSQEISLDLQHLIDDQFRDSEAFGLISDIVSVGSTNGILPAATSAAAKVALQQARLQQPQNTYRSQLAYMPQPVHTGANYNNSSDENSSVGSSDGTPIKEEPVDPMELRRQAVAAASAAQNGQFTNGGAPAQNGNGVYPNYAQNGNGNTFTTLTPTSVLHHQGLPHMSHLANLTKHKQLLPSARKQAPKSVDKGTEEYRRRRERNNIAVRKSREKAKVRSREVEERVKALLKEKDALMRRLEEMSQEVNLHKQIYLHLMNHNNPEIKQICTSVLNLVNMGDHGLDWSK